MKKYLVLEAATLEELNNLMNKHSKKYAPVGNLIYAGEKFIQQIELTEEGEELLAKEALLNYVEIDNVDDLKVALSNSKEIHLIEDLSLEGLLIEKPTKINLCGHTLTLVADTEIQVYADLELSNGSIVAEGAKVYAIRAFKGEVSLDKVVINGEEAYGAFTTRPEKKEDVSVKINGCKFYAKNAGFVPVGGVCKISNTELYAVDEATGWYAVSGNGNSFNPPSDLIAEDCVFVANAPDGGAVYWPTDGKLQLKNCDLTGAVAAYIKCGDVRLAGGKYTAIQAEKMDYVYSGNGFNVTGDVIVCDACNYPKKDAKVSILGVEFVRACEDAYDVAEYEKEDHTSTQVVKVATNLKAKVSKL